MDYMVTIGVDVSHWKTSFEHYQTEYELPTIAGDCCFVDHLASWKYTQSDRFRHTNDFPVESTQGIDNH